MAIKLFLSLELKELTQGNNIFDFLNASLAVKAPFKMGTSLKRRNLLKQEQVLSFSTELIHVKKGGKNENNTVAFPESVLSPKVVLILRPLNIGK